MKTVQYIQVIYHFQENITGGKIHIKFISNTNALYLNSSVKNWSNGSEDVE